MLVPVLVGNLNFETEEEALRSELAAPNEVYLAISKQPRRSRGFAVTMAAEDVVEEFVTRANTIVLDGRPIRALSGINALPVIVSWMSATPEECPDSIRDAVREYGKQMAKQGAFDSMGSSEEDE